LRAARQAPAGPGRAPPRMLCCVDANSQGVIELPGIDDPEPLEQTPALQLWDIDRNKGTLLTVAVLGARALRGPDWVPAQGRSDCYCVLRVRGRDCQHTSSSPNAIEPVWQEEMELDHIPGDDLEFCIYDRGEGRKELLGRGILESKQFKDGFNGELMLAAGAPGAADLVPALRLKVRSPQKHYPDDAPDILHVHVTKRSNEQLGLELDFSDGETAYVVGVQFGAMHLYNQTAKAQDRVRIGDFVISVNGTRGSGDGLLEKIKTSSRLDMVVHRPVEFSVAVDLGDRPLGLELMVGAACLLVGKVLDGATQDWNEANPDQQVRSKDRIIAVGNERASGEELLERLRATKRLGLRLARPCEANVDPSWYV